MLIVSVMPHSMRTRSYCPRNLMILNQLLEFLLEKQHRAYDTWYNPIGMRAYMEMLSKDKTEHAAEVIQKLMEIDCPPVMLGKEEVQKNFSDEQYQAVKKYVFAFNSILAVYHTSKKQESPDESPKWLESLISQGGDIQRLAELLDHPDMDIDAIRESYGFRKL